METPCGTLLRSGMNTAGMNTAGMNTAGMNTAGMNTAATSALAQNSCSPRRTRSASQPLVQPRSIAAMMRVLAVLLLATDASRADSLAGGTLWGPALRADDAALAARGGRLDAAAVSSGMHGRSLLHGMHGKWWLYPQCKNHKCRKSKCLPSGTLWKGHCRKGKTVCHCFKWKSGPAKFNNKMASNAATNSDANATRAGSTVGVIDAVFEETVGKNTLVVVGVACFDDDDCALPSTGFAAVNGSVPVSSSGVLTARCVRGELDGEPVIADDEPGICMCVYRGSDGDAAPGNGTASGSAAGVAEVTSGPRRRPGGRRLQQLTVAEAVSNATNVSTSAGVTVTSSSFVDLCIQLPAAETRGGRVSDDSFGVIVPGVVNSSASSAGLISINVTDDGADVAEDTETDGFVMPEDLYVLAYGDENLYAYEAYEAFGYELDEDTGEVTVTSVDGATVGRANGTDEFNLTMQLRDGGG